MKKFTVKIDLSSFFNDQRKLVILMVDPKWTSISALQQRVEQLFEIKPVLFLTADDCFIPPSEPIKILSFFSIVKAFIPEESLRKKFRRTQVPAVEECIGSDIVPVLSDGVKQKKRKFQALENSCKSSTPNQAKRSKNILDAPLKEKLCEITSTNEVVTCTEPQIYPLTNGDINLSGENAAVVEEITNVEVPKVSSNKKKRKRKNKKKAKLSQSTSEEQASLDTSCDISMLSSTQNRNNKDMRFSTNPQSKAQHIFFGSKTVSPDASKNVTVEKEREFLSFRCGVINNERRQFNDSIFNRSKNKSIAIIEHIIIPPKETPYKSREICETDAQQTSWIKENSCNKSADSNRDINDISKNGNNINRRGTFCVANDESIKLNEVVEFESITTPNKCEISKKIKEKSPNVNLLLVEQEKNCMNNVSDINQTNDDNTGLNISDASFINLNSETNNTASDSSLCKSKITTRSQITIPLNESVENLNRTKKNEKSDILEVSNVSVHNDSNIFQMDVTNMNNTKVSDDVDDMENKSMNITNRTEPLELGLNNSSVMSIVNECDDTDREVDLSITTEESKLNEQLADSNLDMTNEAELPRISNENYNHLSMASENTANESELSVANKTGSDMDFTFDENTDEEPEVIDLDETENETFLMDKTKSVPVGEADIEKQLKVSKPLNDLPSVGDIVIFKMLRLDESCTPIITEHIKGICEYVNKRTKNIKWRILDGHSQIHRIPSKFATEFDDSTDTEIINIKLNDMIEPKLLKTS